MHEVLVNRLGGLSLPRKSVVKLTYPPDMTLDVYRGRKTTTTIITTTKEPKQKSRLGTASNEITGDGGGGGGASTSLRSTNP